MRKVVPDPLYRRARGRTVFSRSGVRKIHSGELRGQILRAGRQARGDFGTEDHGLNRKRAR